MVNTVMATNIMDKDIKKLRNDRWDAAFALTSEQDQTSRRAVNRKATIVIEHLIQAPDVSHTMQHWHIYRKWNKKLFNVRESPELNTVRWNELNKSSRID
jgi:hypothetical protein